MADLILPFEDLKNMIFKEAKNTKLFIKEVNNPKLAVWWHLCIQAPSDIVPASPHLLSVYLSPHEHGWMFFLLIIMKIGSFLSFWVYKILFPSSPPSASTSWPMSPPASRGPVCSPAPADCQFQSPGDHAPMLTCEQCTESESDHHMVGDKTGAHTPGPWT